MIEILFFTFIIAGTLFFIGLGVGAFLLPSSLSDESLWIAPWLGTICIAVLSVYLSMLGLPMKFGSIIIIVISVSSFVYALYRKKIKVRFSLELCIVSFLTLSIFLFNMAPLFKVGLATVVSLGNLDPLAYVNPADFLVNHGVLGNTFDRSLYPAHAALADIINYSYRWGSVIIMSFFNSLLSVHSYQIYSILITFYFALTFPLVYILAKMLVGIRKNDWLIMHATFLTYGFNATLLYILYNVFFGQIVFDGLLILFIIFLITYLRSAHDEKIIKKEAIMAGISLAAALAIYPDGFIMLYVPIVGCAVLSYVFSRKLFTSLRIAKVVLISILVNPFLFYIAVKWAYRLISVTTNDQKIGWEPIRYSLPHEFLGFYNLHYYRDLPLPLDLIIALACIALFAFGFWRIKEKLLVSMYLLLFLALLFIFRFITPNFFVYHRTITYALFLFSILFAVGVSFIFAKIRKKNILIVCLIVLTFLSIRSARRTLLQMTNHMRIVDRALISLGDVNAMTSMSEPIVMSDIFSPTYDVWVRLWREYFLHDKKLISLSNLGQHKKDVHENSLVLLEKSPIYSGSSAFLMHDVIWENNYYRLGKICKSDECLLNSDEDFPTIDFKYAPYQDALLGTGWDAREDGQRWVSSSEASLRLFSKKASSTQLVIKTRTVKEPQTMSVFVNDISLGKIQLKESSDVYTFPLQRISAGKIISIRFTFDHQYIPAEIGLNEDIRNLAANFVSIGLK